ncbi:hypothetical protein GCM10009540_70530 [Streptomyces turgidiscabies]
MTWRQNLSAEQLSAQRRVSTNFTFTCANTSTVEDRPDFNAPRVAPPAEGQRGSPRQSVTRPNAIRGAPRSAQRAEIAQHFQGARQPLPGLGGKLSHTLTKRQGAPSGLAVGATFGAHRRVGG